MTSAKVLLAPLLERNADLARVGNVVVVKRIRHVLGGISIEAGDAPERFRPVWFFVNLLGPHRSAMVENGVEVGGYKRDDWAWSQPRVQQDLAQALEDGVLPLLRAVQELEAMVNLNAAVGGYHHRVHGVSAARQFVVKIALGQLDVAHRWLTTGMYLDKRVKIPHEPNEDERHFIAWAKQVAARLEKDDRAGMARMLHEWEAETVRLMKLEHLWEPTPFPLELS